MKRKKEEEPREKEKGVKKKERRERKKEKKNEEKEAERKKWREEKKKQKKERAVGSVTGLNNVGPTHHVLLPKCHLIYNLKSENTKKLFLIFITHSQYFEL